MNGKKSLGMAPLVLMPVLVMVVTAGAIPIALAGKDQARKGLDRADNVHDNAQSFQPTMYMIMQEVLMQD
jgi:hypothetical protein